MQLEETRPMPMTVFVDESDTDDMDGADVAVPNDDQEEEPILAIPPKPKPVVDIVEVDNPEYVSYNQPLREMMQSFVTDHLKVPSITYETFHGFVIAVVESIYAENQAKRNPRDIRMRFVAGFVDKELAGFMMVTMLPQRLPHISTLQVTYIHSLDIHVTAAFIEHVAKYKKLWRAKHIACIAVNDRVRKALERVLTGYQLCGYYVYGFSPKNKAVSNFVDAL